MDIKVGDKFLVGGGVWINLVSKHGNEIDIIDISPSSCLIRYKCQFKTGLVSSFYFGSAVYKSLQPMQNKLITETVHKTINAGVFDNVNVWRKSSTRERVSLNINRDFYTREQVGKMAEVLKQIYEVME